MKDESGLLVLREDASETIRDLPRRNRRMFFAGLAASAIGEAALIWHALSADTFGAGFGISLALLIAGNCVILADMRTK
ncbi:hypothetical protein [Candidatus Nitrosotenuis cloacae]|uniref:hypothetical protein n=1 Tax=Candidatus Nitrosotenuis cloacae TaxID=1603555 RepID=UPI00227FB80A|nr:hypothetical protein [Candidatus Nitrosotenuis cloacae]